MGAGIAGFTTQKNTQRRKDDNAVAEAPDNSYNVVKTQLSLELDSQVRVRVRFRKAILFLVDSIVASGSQLILNEAKYSLWTS